MRKKRHTIVYRVFAILIFALTVTFGTGTLILKQLEQSNMDYIYQLTKELVSTSITEMEAEFSRIRTNIYDIVVSDAIQRAGSVLLAGQDEEDAPSGMARSSSINTIINGIQQEISSNHSIVCANFLDFNGNLQVIAATRYYKLSREAAKRVEQAATEAAGDTVFLGDPELTGDKDILIVAKQLREKKNLSLKHIGVVVLFVDVNRLGTLLTDTHDGIYVVQNGDGSIRYVLNGEGRLSGGEEGETADPDVSSLWETVSRTDGYSICRLGDVTYFAVAFERKGGQFTYLVLTPYTELFSDVKRVFRIYMEIFLLCSLFAFAVSFVFAHRITRDIRQFIHHIHHISWENFTQLPLYESDRIVDRDIYELKNAFNTMSMRINDLVKENYMKQLLIKETQLSALQAQMNPHFLYNTLNSIYWMAKTEGVPRVAEMINSLSLLLREAISADELVIVIDKELDIVCHYITIQKQRYGDRLTIVFDVSETCSNLAIPKFTIQPLLENAIAYGAECMLEPCTITVRIFTEEEDCICEVRNNGPAPKENLMEKLRSREIVPHGNGVSLLNIDRRIKTVFGEQYGISVYRDREQEETVVSARFRKVSMEMYGKEKRDETNL